jgi:hypothetical protein
MGWDEVVSGGAASCSAACEGTTTALVDPTMSGTPGGDSGGAEGMGTGETRAATGGGLAGFRTGASLLAGTPGGDGSGAGAVWVVSAHFMDTSSVGLSPASRSSLTITGRGTPLVHVSRLDAAAPMMRGSMPRMASTSRTCTGSSVSWGRLVGGSSILRTRRMVTGSVTPPAIRAGRRNSGVTESSYRSMITSPTASHIGSGTP